MTAVEYNTFYKCLIAVHYRTIRSTVVSEREQLQHVSTVAEHGGENRGVVAVEASDLTTRCR